MMIDARTTRPRLVVVDGVRTPFCKMGTALAGLGAEELGRLAVQALLIRTDLDPALVDETIMGCVGQPPDAANVARVIALRAGIPEKVPAYTVHRNCASGCESITQAYEKMCAGVGEIFVVGGTESMSRYPLLFKHATAIKFGQLARARTLGQRIGGMLKFRPSDFQPRITLKLGLTDPVCDLNMGETAEIVGRENGVTRQLADEFSLQSHQRAVAAEERLAEEIAPVYLPPKYTQVIEKDVGPRKEQSMQQLGKLRPVFDRSGMVTAGNASQITDGAVALLVMSEDKAAELGYEPLGILSGYAYAGCDPARMGLGPVYAMARAEEKVGLGVADADLVEINEAFAAQVLGCLATSVSDSFGREELGRDRALGEIPQEKLNVNGGAIALGHPVGSTGSRLTLTMLKELKRRNARRGLVSLCIGGGQGAALWLERP